MSSSGGGPGEGPPRPQLNPYFSASLFESAVSGGGNDDADFGLSSVSIASAAAAKGSKEIDDDDDELVECVVFTQKDLAAVSMPVMEDIRRQGKLCDVVIKVRVQYLDGSEFASNGA